MSGGNNQSFSPWKPNVSLDIVAASNPSNYSSVLKMAGASSIGVASHSIPMATLTALPSHSDIHHVPSHLFSPAVTLQRHHHSTQILPQQQAELIAATPTLAHHQIDVYSQLGMQRLGQMYKSNIIVNNNNNNNNNNNTNNNNNFSHGKFDDGKSDATSTTAAGIQQIVEGAIGTEAKQQIMQILEKISLLQPPERLLLYLRLPSGTSETDPLRQPQNPLGTRSEINHTINWVRSHLQHDPNVSIPKQDVYDDYVTFCTREDIKPLSTADFGKVMKQIFPGIRPRRLGTRGNSRYCYAAMRKTTTLDCPYLPDLAESRNPIAKFGKNAAGGFTVSTESVEESTTTSWNIVKTWAESLLGTDFQNIGEMSEYISKNYLNNQSPAVANSSRLLLQKKLLQRKVKGRKKNAANADNLVTGMKKRRKKKHKAMASSDTSRVASPTATAASTNNDIAQVPENSVQIKQEIKSNASPEGQQIMPINLKTSDVPRLKHEFSPSGGNGSVGSVCGDDGNSSETGMSYGTSFCKIEINDVDQTFHCKKVKRAHECKAAAAALSPKSMPATSPQPVKVQNQLSPSSALMRPPHFIDSQHQTQATDLSVGSGEGETLSTISPSTEAAKRLNSGSAAPSRPKRLRFRKHASVAGLNETKVDDITTDIIIPRERVISICNMDKDALDDYLNEGDNSQEQEAELLQYFQPPTTGATTVTSTTSNDTGNVTTSVASAGNATNVETTTSSIAATVTSTSNNSSYPLLENYQVYQQHQQQQQQPPVGPTIVAMHENLLPLRKQEQIKELRQYLQQNLHSTSSSSTQNVNAMPSNEMPLNVNQSNIPASPASAFHSTTAETTFPKTSAPKSSMTQPNHVPPQLMRSISASATVGTTLQSPNTRRKNFSFVPISPGPQSPRVISQQTNVNNSTAPTGMMQTMRHVVDVQSSPFVSPRATPAIRKPINKDLTACLTSLHSDPMIGSCKTAFSKPFSSKGEISASAPVSPSITPHHFNFNAITSFGQTSNAAPPTTSNIQLHQQQSNCPISGMYSALESRSQSVPLHCQSPAFNTPATNTAYSSTCNSIAQTPVPSEFTDFSDENILNILAETSVEQNIKLESNGISDLMDTTNSIDAMLPEMNARNSISNMSRSVPSTPLPIRGYGPHNLPLLNTSTAMASNVVNSKSAFDISKSVPTTPIGMMSNGSNGTPFCYSPEHHRDFLINGNTIETGKTNHFFPTTQSQVTSTTHQSIMQPPMRTANSIAGSGSDSTGILSNEMDDLSNYNDVNDPIIAGSDLLHSL